VLHLRYVLDWQQGFEEDSQKTSSETQIHEIGERRGKKKSHEIKPVLDAIVTILETRLQNPSSSLLEGTSTG
jgi:hypothetical protein